MNKKAAMAVIIAGLITFGVVLWALSKPEDSTSDRAPNNSQTTTGERTSAETIVYTDDGFSNPNLTVKSGTTITIRNESSGRLEFSSDSHPTHQDNDELNTEIIGPGESTDITVTEPGTWSYHDHLNESRGGTITVVQ